MTILGLIVALIIIGVIVWLIHQMALPTPWNWIVQALLILVLIFFLFQVLGINIGLGTQIH